MKRFTAIFFLFVFFLAGANQPASAQFWKNWFKKEKRKPVKKKPKNTKEKAAIPEKKKHEILYPVSVNKSRYRIDVFAQLYLNELIKDGKTTFKGKIPEKAVQGIDFYEGVKLAADTLKNYGYNIEVFIHDIMDSIDAPETLIKKKMLDSTDLIIGCVSPSHFKALTEFAKSRKINFVSALSPLDDGIRDDPYFILLQPALQTHCDWLLNYMFKKYPGKKPVFFYRSSSRLDENAYSYLKKDSTSFLKIIDKALPSKEQLKSLLDSTQTNLMLFALMDHLFAEKQLVQLYKWFPNYKFDVYGMPSWKSMNSLKKPDAYPNIAVHFTSPFYFDPTTPAGQAVANLYKQEAGSAKPSEMVYRGYETMHWFAYLLNKYGTVFNTKLGDNGVAPFTRFDIKPQWDGKDDLLYNENKHIYLYRYQGGSYIVEQ